MQRLLFFCLLLLTGCRQSGALEEEDVLAYLYQTWENSLSESQQDRFVFRTANYNFTETGYRQKFIFTPADVQVSVSQSNKVTLTRGTYSVIKDGNQVKELTITYTAPGQKQPTVIHYQVLILSKDLLLVRPI
ncbi:hypothetical protein [Siphonobacter aquaeclarae]|uniref:Uncharacterized protein n=1 Tax=Siphonobacter aquaeclarae TaxID=563176 RepID=A0A1G9S0R5_9BACT|nr:hypothetical protein [Siphonobacter aquaeclarae]SDM29056.1 hypothetical protein SAMN04488090_3130 [Siphonobacter aquaeclarae]